MKHLARKNPDGSCELLIDHLNNVADLAAKFAGQFGAAEFGRIVGLAHDFGKFSDAFQRRVRGDKTPVDHSTAGGQLFENKALAYVVMGHHTGLPNGAPDHGSDPSSLQDRLAKDVDLGQAVEQAGQLVAQIKELEQGLELPFEAGDTPYYELAFFFAYAFFLFG